MSPAKHSHTSSMLYSFTLKTTVYMQILYHLFTFFMSHKDMAVRQKYFKTWTHQSKVQIPTGLMSFHFVSWPKQFSSYYQFPSVVVSLELIEHKGLIRTVFSKHLVLRCVSYLNSGTH